MRVTVASSGLIALIALGASAFAHHGTSISYKMDEPWTTEAVVVEFTYTNPHPRLVFDRTNEKGEVEHWESELITNPSMMLRAGWNRSRSTEALQPGTKVRLTLSTSKANPRSAVVRSIQNSAGEYIVMGRREGDPPPSSNR